MRIIAFVLDWPQVERFLEHIAVIGGHAWMPTEPERLPPVGRRATADAAPGGAAGAIAAAPGVRVQQTPAIDDWPEMDQTAGQGADGWE